MLGTGVALDAWAPLCNGLNPTLTLLANPEEP
jgi:hypothetical protein